MKIDGPQQTCHSYDVKWKFPIVLPHAFCFPSAYLPNEPQYM